MWSIGFVCPFSSNAAEIWIFYNLLVLQNLAIFNFEYECRHQEKLNALQYKFWMYLYEKCSMLLRSEIPSGICAKLRTVAASNNRVHMPWSLCYCLFAPHVCMVLFFTHIPFVLNHTINATLPERLEQYVAKLRRNYNATFCSSSKKS